MLHSHVATLSAHTVRLIRAVMTGAYIDIGRMVVDYVLSHREKPALLAFPCLLTSMCSASEVLGIRATGQPKGLFNTSEALKVLEDAEGRRRGLAFVGDPTPIPPQVDQEDAASTEDEDFPPASGVPPMDFSRHFEQMTQQFQKW